jgi:hypothetical protein
MWTLRHARRLTVLSVLIADAAFGGDKQYGKVGPGTIGAFAGPIRRNPGC